MHRFSAKHAVFRVDRRIRGFLARLGIPLLRWTLALIFIWFGVLKPFDLSAANDLVKRTIYWLPPEVFLPILGWWEVAIGLCLLWRPCVRLGVLLLFLQMPGTFLPMVLLPEVCWESFPLVLTMEGQYIVKNLVLIAAAIVVGSQVPPLAAEGGRTGPEPTNPPQNPSSAGGNAPVRTP